MQSAMWLSCGWRGCSSFIHSLDRPIDRARACPRSAARLPVRLSNQGADGGGAGRGGRQAKASDRRVPSIDRSSTRPVAPEPNKCRSSIDSEEGSSCLAIDRSIEWAKTCALEKRPIKNKNRKKKTHEKRPRRRKGREDTRTRGGELVPVKPLSSHTLRAHAPGRGTRGDGTRPTPSR